jgi:hypothetical protein
MREASSQFASSLAFSVEHLFLAKFGARDFSIKIVLVELMQLPRDGVMLGAELPISSCLRMFPR